jgi:HD-GYP domain-containing protein (c-di-GMP phosphodiesterase class II)
LPHKRIKVDIAFIAQGMYVAQLDRPWLESPFSVHGFEINEGGQIDLLRKFCKYVYVDVERSSLDKSKILAAHTSKSNDPFSKPVAPHQSRQSNGAGGFIGELMSRLGLSGFARAGSADGKQYRTIVSMKKEAPPAAAAFVHATQQLSEILSDIKNGNSVNVDKLRDAVDPMVDSILRNPGAMSWLCYMPDRTEVGYCLSIPSSVWAVIVGRHLEFDRSALSNLAMGGAVLNIGNANIPESFVIKDGPPTTDEAEILKSHVKYGIKLVKSISGTNEDVLGMVACHHERHDGSGYPKGLAGKDIPVLGRIAGLVNCYQEMVMRKRYGTPKSAYDAICELNGLGGTQFQNELVQHFLQAVGMFPTGSLVGLNTGEVAIVVEQNQARRLRPRLKVMLNPDKSALSPAKDLDLGKVPDSGTDPNARWIVQGHEAGAFDIDLKQEFLGEREMANA